jgi:hypothetical protein
MHPSATAIAEHVQQIASSKRNEPCATLKVQQFVRVVCQERDYALSGG